MKTGELFAEQVLIGAVILATCAVPWAREISAIQLEQVNIVLGIAGVGLCFLLGLIFDRWADTFTERLVSYHRLSFAAKKLRQVHKENLQINTWGTDPFDERAFKLKLLRDKDQVIEWANYHRSRIRLSRALAVYLPGLSFALTIGGIRYLSQCTCVPIPVPHAAWLLLVPVTYGIAIAFFNVCGPIPKTYDKKAFDYANEKGLLDITERDYGKRRASFRQLLKTDPFVVSSTLLLVLSVLLSIASLLPELILISIGTLLLSMLSGWTWWRISETYLDFLYQVGSSDNVDC